jgi:CDP-glucose 4,6-dehydratase
MREDAPETRVVIASSDKAYGSHAELPYREDFALRPSYPYDVSKAATDLIARSYAATFGMPVAVTRLANVYGPGDVNWARVVPDTARALVHGERPVIRSDGTPERDYLFVEDAVAAYLVVAGSLDDPANHGRAWNAGSGEPLSVLEIVTRLIAVSGHDVEPDIQGAGVPHGEIDRQYLDSTAIREELGWAPEWDLDRGLRATWEWYERTLG